jgi:hypothetical protein
VLQEVASCIALSQLVLLEPALTQAFQGLGWSLGDLELEFRVHHRSAVHFDDSPSNPSPSASNEVKADKSAPRGADSAAFDIGGVAQAAPHKTLSVLRQLKVFGAAADGDSVAGTGIREGALVPSLDLIVRGRPSLTIAFELCSGLVCLHGGSSSIPGLPFCTVCSTAAISLTSVMNHRS